MIYVGVILVLLGVIIITAVTDCDLRAIVGIFAVTVGIIIFIAGNHPTAMDVYQGKTTLKTTYVDSIPVDSVVVFKDK